MYNLHCHSLLSDGALLPSEIAVRFAALGYKAIAITDHVDYSNIKSIISGILEFTRHWPKDAVLRVLPGIELTHLPLEQFKPLAKYARRQGIQIIIGHGETLAEPIVKGTNRAALEADIDILAHPGLITDEDLRLAKEKNIFLEITARAGHRETNSHVARQAIKMGSDLIINLDSHTPEDIINLDALRGVGLNAGLSANEIIEIDKTVGALLKRKGAG